MELPPEFAHVGVPTIGEPFECFDPHVVVPARCKCSPENKPFLIAGLNLMVTCKRCMKRYVIQSVSFDRTTGSPIQVTVGCVIAPQAGAN